MSDAPHFVVPTIKAYNTWGGARHSRHQMRFGRTLRLVLPDQGVQQLFALALGFPG